MRLHVVASRTESIKSFYMLRKQEKDRGLEGSHMRDLSKGRRQAKEKEIGKTSSEVQSSDVSREWDFSRGHSERVLFTTD